MAASYAWTALAKCLDRTGGGDVDRAADAVDVLRDSTLSARFALAPAALPLELDPLRDPTRALAFNCRDLRPTDGRFAAFFVALDFDLAFVAMAVPNSKWVAQKSQGVRSEQP